nr:unnamed protein product [Callosobruchus analis]
MTACMLYLKRRHWENIKATLQVGDKWEAARKSVGALWDTHGFIWHG